MASINTDHAILGMNGGLRSEYLAALHKYDGVHITLKNKDDLDKIYHWMQPSSTLCPHCDGFVSVRNHTP